MFWAVTLCVLIVGMGVSVVHSATVVSVAVDLGSSSSCLFQRLGLSRPPKFCLCSATPVLSHPTSHVSCTWTSVVSTANAVIRQKTAVPDVRLSAPESHCGSVPTFFPPGFRP
jgi:hypothetical protein